MFENLKHRKRLKILFICSSNIMRSPIAEMLFEKLLTQKYGDSWHGRIEIASGAVRFKKTAIHPLTRELLLSEGIPEKRLTTFKPRHVDDHPELFSGADLIIAMTEGQMKRLLKRNPGFKPKTLLLVSFLREKRSIPDPWLSLRRKKALASTAETIKAGLIGLLQKLEINGFLG